MRKYTIMTKYFLVPLVICGLGLCTGCGKTTESPQTEDLSDTSDELSENIPPADAVPSESEESPPAATGLPENESASQAASPSENKNSSQSETYPPEDENSPQDSSVGQSDGAETEELPAGRRLTPEELQTYTELLQDYSNYGFLLSDWSIPTEINLYEVFYNGAGISRDGTEAEIQAFLERNGQDALYTDFFVIDKTAVNNFLQEKIGLTYDEFVMKGGKGMEGSYYAESDSFCMETGDTNYMTFECTDGVENEEGYIVTLHYKGEYSWIQKGEVQMWKDGSSFRSNHFLEGDILDTNALSQ